MPCQWSTVRPLALAAFRSSRDAFLVPRLRSVGAVILGKTQA